MPPLGLSVWPKHVLNTSVWIVNANIYMCFISSFSSNQDAARSSISIGDDKHSFTIMQIRYYYKICKTENVDMLHSRVLWYCDKNKMNQNWKLYNVFQISYYLALVLFGKAQKLVLLHEHIYKHTVMTRLQ